MKKLFWFIVGFILIFSIGIAQAAEVTLKWEASADATGYKVYKSLDSGTTWDAGVDVGDVTEYIYTGVEETGLVLFRVSAYNSFGETISYWSGAFYNHLWLPP